MSAQQYDKWIAENVVDDLGTCAEVTIAMVKKFPELKRVRGHYHCPIWGERAHWWCIASNGKIIDPTASQFPSKGSGVYIVHVEGSPEPTGKCLDCGSYVYNEDTFCDDTCERRTRSYLGV